MADEEWVTCPACNGSSRRRVGVQQRHTIATIIGNPTDNCLCPHCKPFGPFGLVPYEHEVLITLQIGRGRDEGPRVRVGSAFADWLTGDGGADDLQSKVRAAENSEPVTFGDD